MGTEDPSHPWAFVTGASSGIGEATCRELLNRGWHVLGASRRGGPIADSAYTHVSLDLSDVTGLTAHVENSLGQFFVDPSVSRFALVNNAADPGLLGPVEKLDPAAMLRVFAVNVASPTWLMGWFARHSRVGVPLRIVNISSGAAEVAIPGLATYGSTKAALRMTGMVLGAELDSASSHGRTPRDVSILSYDPGTVDTPMQTEARSTSSDVLPSVEVFAGMAKDGQLVSPAESARDIADYVESDGHATFSEQSYETA